MAVTAEDTQMPVNHLVYALAAPNRIGDYNWIKPGKVAWEWWNDWGISGVDFKVGINTPTYKRNKESNMWCSTKVGRIPNREIS